MTPIDVAVDPAVRGRRRRAVFAAMLRGTPHDEVADSHARSVSLIRLAFVETTPETLVRELFREILGRDVDPTGLESWQAALVAGGSALDVAWDLASTREAEAAPPHRRTRVAEQLRLWSDVLLAVDLGLVDWQVVAGGQAPGRARAAAFVETMYDVGLARVPTGPERAGDIGLLVGGQPRDEYARMFAGRPEVVERVTGRALGRVQRRLARRGIATGLAPAVAAAYDARVAEALEVLTRYDEVLLRARGLDDEAGTAPGDDDEGGQTCA